MGLSSMRGVTDQNLSNILKSLNHTGVSRRSIGRAEQEITNAPTPYGLVIQNLQLPSTSGGTITLPFIHPMAMLHFLALHVKDRWRAKQKGASKL